MRKIGTYTWLRDGDVVEERPLFTPKPGLGDIVQRALGNILGVKKLPCYDAAGNLRPETGCAERKKKLNKLGDRLKRKLVKAYQK